MPACDASRRLLIGQVHRIVVPFLPGDHDFLARGIGQQFTATWGQPVIIDNRTGGAGILATDIVAKAAPDGHTLLMNAINHTVNPSLYRKLPYDTLRDFAPIALVADVDHSRRGPVQRQFRQG
jgi:tripartite-type tricarboxylate transporter receptor subunit TctC